MAVLGFKEILELIDKVGESGISSVEIESAGLTLRIEGAASNAPPPQTPVSASSAGAQSVSAPPTAPQASSAPAADAGDEIDPSWQVVTSPIVGTFYRSANPEAAPFVDVGDRVGKGAVLCIIEAMKLMNEIESEFDGTVAKIFPENGQPIEYGEKLFAIRP